MIRILGKILLGFMVFAVPVAVGVAIMCLCPYILPTAFFLVFYYCIGESIFPCE